MEITSSIIEWYEQNKRDLPWRNTTDPYKIWLSEIILQQTRVQQGMPYYEKFLAHYPTIESFANAEEQEILSLWQGLGYYSRARNMHETAKTIVSKFKGKFPDNYEDILALKGVGEYTAAAIASFAYNLPHPVLDGNVYRVLSRLYGITDPIDKPAGQKVFKQTLQLIFDPKRIAQWNQAIMEFGALQCVPKSPDCNTCPLEQQCEAQSKNLIGDLPRKAGKTKVKSIEYTYLVFKYENKVHINQRTSGTWKNMFEFPLIESHFNSKQLPEKINALIQPNQKIEIGDLFEYNHLLSHRKISAKFYTIYLESKPVFLKSDIFEIELDALGNEYPVSTLIKKYLDQKRDDK